MKFPIFLVTKERVSTDYQEQKMRAVACYQSQAERYPDWLDAVEARDRYYGWMINQEGLYSTTHAEGFVVQRMVWP